MKMIILILLFIFPVYAQDDRYRIGPADVLDIRIYNRPQLSRDAVRVEGNGMIRMYDSASVEDIRLRATPIVMLTSARPDLGSVVCGALHRLRERRRARRISSDDVVRGDDD